MNVDAVIAHVENVWRDDIVHRLHEYIAVPCVSAAFDADWAANGHIHRATHLIADWCRMRAIPGMSVEVHELAGRSPVILVEVVATPGSSNSDTVLLYGHLDKQPEMTGWRAGLSAWTPVREGDRLYGRGGADDGYSAFASLAAIEALRAAGGSHTRCVMLIESSEESGSTDLPAYVSHLAERLGTPSLVVCLDSGCADYDHLWTTTSLRGLVSGVLTVHVLDEGVHSGEASGIVPSSFRLIRQLLDRIEDATTGRVLLPELHAEIPPHRRQQAIDTANVLGHPVSDDYPFTGTTRPVTPYAVDQLLNRTWRPTLSYISADGFPPSSRAGNVLRPSTSLGLSFRLPPTVDADLALAAVSAALTGDPPAAASVTFHDAHAASGWDAPANAAWLSDALTEASEALFERPSRSFGEGGSIPFMGMLGARFPDAQFIVTGVLGPDSNAHGPNEYLHIPTAERLTSVIALLLDNHARR